MIKCLLTELGRAGRENIWLSVMPHGLRCARSVRHDLEPNIFPSGPPTQSISTYYHSRREIEAGRFQVLFLAVGGPNPSCGQNAICKHVHEKTYRDCFK